MTANPRVSNSTRYKRFVSKVKARGDVCAICWHPIDYSIPTLEPMSFEADHIIPISKEGSEYDPANGQASHRCCNIWRGDKPMSLVDAIMSGDMKPKTPPPIWRDGARPGDRVTVTPTFDW